MTTYGLTEDGFVDKPLEVIRQEIADDLLAAIDPNLDLTESSPLGIIIGVLAGHLRQSWEVAQSVYSAFDPDKAVGASLAALAALTATLKRPATRSTVGLQLFGSDGDSDGTLIRAGSVVAVSGNSSARFRTIADATLVLGDFWASLHAYSVGERITSGGLIWEVITAGTSGGSSNPEGAGPDVVDGTVHWKSLGAGIAFAEVEAESEAVAPVVANANTLTVIATPVSHWTGVNNPLDAVVGLLEESTSALRLRREQELRAAGAAAFEAVRSDLLQVDGVTEVFLFQNDTDATDGDGLPPHSFEAVVRGGDDQDIADKIWATKALGIATYGSETESVEDSQGTSHAVKFTRPTVKTVYLGIDITVDAETYPSDGDAQVVAAVVAFGDANLGTGDDVVLTALYPAIFSVSGVLDVTAVRAGFTASPVGTVNLTIAARELADLDTGRTAVTST